MKTRHHLWTSALLALCTCAAMTGCLRDVPGSSCEQSSDCYVGEQCVDNVCVTSETPPADMRDASSLDMPDASVDMPADMPGDATADLDMPVDMPIDMPIDMPDGDMTTDMPVDMPVDMSDMDTPDADMSNDDMTDMPDDDMPVDMPIDMPMIDPEGEVVAMARLPGTRASFMNDTMLAPIVLAYLPDEQGGTLNVYSFDSMQGWVGTQVASQLGWPSTDLSENAAFFDATNPRIIYEKHDAVTGISLRTALFNLSTNTISGDEEILPSRNITSLDFDYIETISGPHVLVLTDKVEHLSRQAGGTWTIQQTYTGDFTLARFVMNAQHICTLTVTSNMACYSSDEPSTPEFTEMNVDTFEASLRPDPADPARNAEYIVLSRNTGLFFGLLEDRQAGPPNDRGIRWRGQPPRGNNLPAGGLISLTSASGMISYQQNTGSSVYSLNANMTSATATPLANNNPVTSARSQSMQLHVVSSKLANAPSSTISYETHGMIP